MDHSDWLDHISGGKSVNTVAREAGLVARTFARHVQAGEINAEDVIAIATAYGLNPVRALVDTGYLESRWAETVDPATALQTVSEEELAAEVLRRMKIGVTTTALTTPIDELASRRPTYEPEAVPEFDPELHVADSSPEEEGTPDDFIP